MTSFFSANSGPIWIKFRRLVQNDVSTAVMWSKSKPDVEFQYGKCLAEFHGMSSQSHVSHCRELPLGEFTVMIPELCYIAGCSHLAKSMSWSCHIAGCNNSIRHIENRFSPYFVFFLFLVQFGLWRAAAFVSSPIHLLLSKFVQKSTHTETRRPTKEKQQQLYTVFIKETATFFVHNS